MHFSWMKSEMPREEISDFAWSGQYKSDTYKAIASPSFAQ